MIHYSCDRCHRIIDPDDEMRYVVRMEIQANFGTNVLAADEDEERDHLLEIHEILERHDAQHDEMVDEDVYSRTRFDLCPECYHAFMRNPLGQDVAKTVNFSAN